jgi:hypothetical protein
MIGMTFRSKHGVDRLIQSTVAAIDRAIVRLLGGQPDGFAIASIRSLVRRRRADRVAAIRLLAAAGGFGTTSEAGGY